MIINNSDNNWLVWHWLVLEVVGSLPGERWQAFVLGGAAAQSQCYLFCKNLVTAHVRVSYVVFT